MDPDAAFRSRSNGQTIRPNPICIYFCRKLMQEGFLVNKQVLLQRNGVRINGTASAAISESGTRDHYQSSSLRRLFSNNSESMPNEFSGRVPQLWNRGEYSPIEVFIDSASVVDQSGPVSIQSSSLLTNGHSPASEISEVEVLDRVNSLRRQGKWSFTRLPLCLEAPRAKTHWDYLLEEVTVMQMDFTMESTAKRSAAKILAYSAKRYVEEKETRKRRALALTNPSEESSVGEARLQELQCPSSLSGGKKVAAVPDLPIESVTKLRSRVAEWSHPFQLRCAHRLTKSFEISTEPYDGELLDGYDCFRTRPLTYDRSLLTDPKLASALSAGWRGSWDVNETRPNDEVCDSLSNPWYSGELIEPDEVEYHKSTCFNDEDLTMDLMDEQENLFAEDDRSFKSTDDSMDFPSALTSADVSQQAMEFSTDFLTPTQPLSARTNMPIDHESIPTKRSYRPPRRSDEAQRKLVGNQILILGDPYPLVRPDGKPGYTPSPGETEWTDADMPNWSLIEDYALLTHVVKQLRAMPIPLYVARSFCVNWDLISRAIRKSAFQDRTQHCCCLHFRELIGAQKKLAPTENIEIPLEKVDEIDVKMMHDPRVKASTLPITRCFIRSLASLTRKSNDMKCVKLMWKARIDSLHSRDQPPKYKVLKSFAERDSCAFNFNAQNKLLQRNEINSSVDVPSEILPLGKKAIPLDQIMVYHQYSRRLRLSRVLATAKVFMLNGVKPVGHYGRISSATRSASLVDGQVFVENARPNETDNFSKAAFARQFPDNLKTQRVIERRLFWTDSSTQSTSHRDLEARLSELLNAHVMLLAMDIRSPIVSSQEHMVDIVDIASKHLCPKRTPPTAIGQQKAQDFNDSPESPIDDELRKKVEAGLKAKAVRVFKNGNSWLPIAIDGNSSDKRNVAKSSISSGKGGQKTKSKTNGSLLKQLVDRHHKRWSIRELRYRPISAVFQLALQIQLHSYAPKFLLLQSAALRLSGQTDGTTFMFSCDRYYKQKIVFNGKPTLRLNVQRTLKKPPRRAQTQYQMPHQLLL